MLRIRLRTILVLAFAGLISVLSGFGPLAVVVLLGLTYVLLQLATTPLSRLIARIEFSIRWKFEAAIALVAVLFLSVGLISFGAMDFIHHELHEIQELGPNRPFQVLRAVDALEDTHHGPLFSMIPFLGVLGVIVAAAIGSAMAWSVVAPVRGMSETMRRIASGDFSQPLQVENRDELGELADSINQTSEELARLRAATVAEERVQNRGGDSSGR